jgi:hypothetical protein
VSTTTQEAPKVFDLAAEELEGWIFPEERRPELDFDALAGYRLKKTYFDKLRDALNQEQFAAQLENFDGKFLFDISVNSGKKPFHELAMSLLDSGVGIEDLILFGRSFPEILLYCRPKTKGRHKFRAAQYLGLPITFAEDDPVNKLVEGKRLAIVLWVTLSYSAPSLGLERETVTAQLIGDRIMAACAQHEWKGSNRNLPLSKLNARVQTAKVGFQFYDPSRQFEVDVLTAIARHPDLKDDSRFLQTSSLCRRTQAPEPLMVGEFTRDMLFADYWTDYISGLRGGRDFALRNLFTVARSFGSRHAAALGNLDEFIKKGVETTKAIRKVLAEGPGKALVKKSNRTLESTEDYVYEALAIFSGLDQDPKVHPFPGAPSSDLGDNIIAAR